MIKENNLPNGWQLKELGEIAHVNDRDHTTPKYLKTGIPLISPKDFTEVSVDFKNPKFVSFGEYQNFNRKCKPVKGDILYSRIGTIGEARPIETKEKFVALHSIAVIKPDRQRVFPEYLLYLLKSDFILRQAKKGTKSIGTPDLGLKEIKRFKVPFPSIPIQKSISAIIKKVEQLKQWRKESNKLTGDYLSNVFLKMFGDPVKNKRNWKIDTVENITSSKPTKGSTPTTYGFNWEESGILFLKSECIISNGISQQGSMYISREAHDFMNRSKVYPGDILIRITGNVGITTIFPPELVTANINQHIAIIRLKEDCGINPIFLLYQLNSKPVRNRYNSITRGVTHPHLSLKQIRETKIIVPPIELQNEFANIVDQLEIVKDCQKKGMKEVNDMFNVLMQRAFRGDLIC